MIDTQAGALGHLERDADALRHALLGASSNHERESLDRSLADTLYELGKGYAGQGRDHAASTSLREAEDLYLAHGALERLAQTRTQLAATLFRLNAHEAVVAVTSKLLSQHNSPEMHALRRPALALQCCSLAALRDWRELEHAGAELARAAAHSDSPLAKGQFLLGTYSQVIALRETGRSLEALELIDVALAHSSERHVLPLAPSARRMKLARGALLEDLGLRAEAASTYRGLLRLRLTPLDADPERYWSIALGRLIALRLRCGPPKPLGP